MLPFKYEQIVQNQLRLQFMRDDQQAAAAGIIAFRCSAELRERVQQAAASEGLKSSDIARRAVLRDLGLAQTDAGRTEIGR
jgi:hypothetical protein